MKRFITTMLAALLVVQTFAATPEVIEMWDNSSAPHSNNLVGEESEEKPGFIKGVTKAVLYIYPAPMDRATGQAVVICPGGGYGGVSMENEGRLMAEWFAKNGVTAAVLKYRMPNGVKEVPYEDVEAAMRVMRQRSRQFGYAFDKVGIVGASAGGHLAAWASTTMAEGVRPNFTVLFYPVISGEEDLTHIWSFRNLLGKDHTDDERLKHSPDRLVDKTTPPAIMILCDDDKVVPAEHSIRYYEALRLFDTTAALVILPSGGHGWGASGRVKGELWQPQILNFLKTINK